MPKPRQLPSGNWRIQWYDVDGKRRSETFHSEAAARAALRRKLVEVDDIRSGRVRRRADQPLRVAAEQWLADRPKKRQPEDRSRLDKHILPFLGDTKLSEINPALIQRFIRKLESTPTSRSGEKNDEGRTLRPNTIKNILITLRKMLNDLEYPVRITYKVPTESYNWLRTPAEVMQFLDACGTGWFRMASELAVYAGLRKGEIAGLRWSAIDFDRGMIRVDRSYNGPTKSKHARWVPLSPELAESLKRWRLRHGGRQLVVTNDTKPLTRATETAKRTRRACRRAGLAEIKFHELRDTYASHLAERVSLPIVGAVLGHVDPKTTARYAHIDTEGLARDPRLHLRFAAPDAHVVALPIRDATGTATRASSAEPAQKPVRTAKRSRG